MDAALGQWSGAGPNKPCPHQRDGVRGTGVGNTVLRTESPISVPANRVDGRPYAVSDSSGGQVASGILGW